MKSSANVVHTHSFAHITKFHDAAKHESKRNDQSTYDAMCEMMQVDACLFSAPQGFATWTTERQMAKVASDFGLVITLPAMVGMEVHA